MQMIKMHRVVGSYVIAMHAFSPFKISIHSIVNIYKIELLKVMSLHNLEIIEM